MVLELPIQVSLGAVVWTQSFIASSEVESPSCDGVSHPLLAHTLDMCRETFLLP